MEKAVWNFLAMFTKQINLVSAMTIYCSMLNLILQCFKHSIHLMNQITWRISKKRFGIRMLPMDEDIREIILRIQPLDQI